MHSTIRVALIGDFNDQQKAHIAIPRSLALASDDSVESVWVPTDAVGRGDSLSEFQGIWCVPGMPYRSAEGAMRAIRHARVTRTPFIGTSAGFQFALIEFARNALGLAEADHQKSNPKCGIPLISPLDRALAGVRSRVRLVDGTHIRKAYGAKESVEEYHCSFGLNPKYQRLLEGSQFWVAAVDDQHDIRAFELDGHPFFVATLFQPEMRCLTEGTPSPLVNAFVRACERQSQGITRVAS
ncbi:CTP synthase [Candidatus Sulfopaludibacter sp. SbA3]|nr:CTP synthase [Candidatus Sulfopaludibacter sp. SbA3]